MKSLMKAARMHRFIKAKQTGSPADFAYKLGISERNLYYILSILRDLGAVIVHDRYEKTYYYKNDFQMELAAKVDLKIDGEKSTINFDN